MSTVTSDFDFSLFNKTTQDSTQLPTCVQMINNFIQAETIKEHDIIVIKQFQEFYTGLFQLLQRYPNDLVYSHIRPVCDLLFKYARLRQHHYNGGCFVDKFTTTIGVTADEYMQEYLKPSNNLMDGSLKSTVKMVLSHPSSQYYTDLRDYILLTHCNPYNPDVALSFVSCLYFNLI